VGDVDFRDPEVREELAKSAYYRERADQAAADAEHDLDPDASYWTIQWEDLSNFAKQPYRTTVAHVTDILASAGVL
jgi:hypothetical protein